MSRAMPLSRSTTSSSRPGSRAMSSMRISMTRTRPSSRPSSSSSSNSSQRWRARSLTPRRHGRSRPGRAAEALFQFLEDDPSLGHFIFVGTYAPPAYIERVNYFVLAFTLFLDQGYGYRPEAAEVPRFIAEVAVCSVLEDLHVPRPSRPCRRLVGPAADHRQPGLRAVHGDRCGGGVHRREDRRPPRPRLTGETPRVTDARASGRFDGPVRGRFARDRALDLLASDGQPPLVAAPRASPARRFSISPRRPSLASSFEIWP